MQKIHKKNYKNYFLHAFRQIGYPKQGSETGLKNCSKVMKLLPKMHVGLILFHFTPMNISNRHFFYILLGKT